MAGEQLKTHFPCTEDDTNELSNEISVGWWKQNSYSKAY
jgi:uncharacterized membrane protein